MPKVLIRKKYLCYGIISFCIWFFPLSVYSAQDTLTLSTYHSSPFGSYDTLRLVPKASGQDYSGQCETGSLYVNSSNEIQFCRGDQTWGPLGSGGLWVREGKDVYLKDSDTNQDLFVGIGTTDPEFQIRETAVIHAYGLKRPAEADP